MPPSVQFWTVKVNAWFALPPAGMLPKLCDWPFTVTEMFSATVEQFVTPAVTGVVGYQTGDNTYSAFNGFNHYWYWNAGLALGVDNITFDFRYWGTDADNAVSKTLTCINQLCDDRFVFTVKVVVP